LEIIAYVRSVKGVEIEVAAERWAHVLEAHDYMSGNLDMVLETVAEPDFVARGRRGELLAVRLFEKTNISKKHCVVVYREGEKGGFVITAFMTSRADKIRRRGTVWERKN